jgi:hypothetical protein
MAVAQRIMVFFPISPAASKTRKISAEDVKQILETMQTQSVRRYAMVAVLVASQDMMGAKHVCDPVVYACVFASCAEPS